LSTFFESDCVATMNSSDFVLSTYLNRRERTASDVDKVRSGFIGVSLFRGHFNRLRSYVKAELASVQSSRGSREPAKSAASGAHHIPIPIVCQWFLYCELLTDVEPREYSTRCCKGEVHACKFGTSFVTKRAKLHHFSPSLRCRASSITSMSYRASPELEHV